MRRIYRAYARGEAPRAIAKGLNKEGVPGSSGGTWGPSTINGNARRGTGILNNELYVGELVWNRLKYVKNPNTGKRQSRLNPADTGTSRRYQSRASCHRSCGTRSRLGKRAWRAIRDRIGAGAEFWNQRPRYLLSGLMKCGACGASYTKYGASRFMCAGTWSQATRTSGSSALAPPGFHAACAYSPLCRRCSVALTK